MDSGHIGILGHPDSLQTSNPRHVFSRTLNLVKYNTLHQGYQMHQLHQLHDVMTCVNDRQNEPVAWSCNRVAVDGRSGGKQVVMVRADGGEVKPLTQLSLSGGTIQILDCCGSSCGISIVIVQQAAETLPP